MQTDYSWFTDYLIEEVIADLVEANPLNRDDWNREAANDYLHNGGLRIYATVDPEVQSVMENVWLEGKYWSRCPLKLRRPQRPGRYPAHHHHAGGRRRHQL